MSFKARRLTADNGPIVEKFPWPPVGAPAPAPTAAGRPGPASWPQPAPSVDPAVERDAFAKGYAQGERAGADAAAARADGMLKRLGQTIGELAALRTELIHRTERQAVQLVLAIAERIVQREVSIDRSLLLGMARAALDRLGEYGTATIRLHPDDYQALGAKSAIADSPVQVLADFSVSRGGCHVQSDFGFMDVSPESQFRELARALLADSETMSAETEPSHGIVLK